EREIAVLNTDRDNLKEYLAKLFTQREEFEAKRNELSEKLGEMNEIEAKLSVDIEGLKEELRLKNELIESVENELAEKERSVDSKRRNVFSASEELSALRNETGRMQASLEALERKEVSLIKDAEDSKKVLGEIDLLIRDVEGSLRDKNAEVIKLSEKKSVYTSEAASLREKIEHLRDELSKTKEDLASRMQSGVGFIRKPANKIDRAVSAFSPPERRLMFCNFLPGGCAIISIPVSRILFSSVRMSSALPPPKSVMKTSENFTFSASNASLSFFRSRKRSIAIAIESSFTSSISSTCLFIISAESFLYLSDFFACLSSAFICLFTSKTISFILCRFNLDASSLF
ncbi:hypothetical protein HKBW3S06_01431, partial [Candidatus Hakubella thermalkaliphila]